VANKDFVVKNSLIVGDTATINGVQIDLSGASSNQVLKFDGTKFAPASEVGDISGTVHSATIGDGTNSTYTITHGLATRNVVVVIRNAASPYESINARWEATTTNSITVDFSSPVTSDSVIVLVYAAVTGLSTGSSYYQTIGNGTDSSFTLTHGFNTRDIVVTARNAASPYEVIDVRWEATTVNTAIIDFSSAPSSNSIRVGIYGTVSGTEVTTIDNLNDVTITSPTSGQVLKYNGTAWVNDTDAGGSAINSLDDVADVTITTAANGDLLKWNGTAWVNASGYALLASPALTGTPTAPTASAATNTTQVATTAFVRAEVAALVGSAGATLDTLGELATALGNDTALSTTLTTSIGLKAPLASPTFTGTVTVPTPSNNTDASTKAYVDAAQSAAQVYADSLTYSISDLTDGVTANAAELNVLDGATLSTAELNILDGATLSTTELNYVDGVTSAIQTQLNTKAPLASPALTGTPTAPTAAGGTNTTQVATTAFVVDAVNTATAANTVELGTDTTGNYMVDVSAGTGISVTHTQGEGSTATVAINATLDNLSDVSVASPTTGQFLKWNGSAWVASNVGASVSSTAPTSPTQGQIWFYQDTAQTFVYYGTAWIEIGGSNGSARVQVSSSAPASPLEGDLWFDSDTAQTFAYYDSQWVEIGASGMAATISDTAPASPIAGQVWFNSSSGATFVYYGAVWVEIGVAPFDQLLSTLDAKGDLLVGTADDAVTKLAAGSANQVLTVDSSTATGLKWATPTVYQAVVSGVSDTEIGYLDGVTSAIQTQLGTKASTGKAIAMAIVFGG